jgi:hypothetical protein
LTAILSYATDKKAQAVCVPAKARQEGWTPEPRVFSLLVPRKPMENASLSLLLPLITNKHTHTQKGIVKRFAAMTFCSVHKRTHRGGYSELLAPYAGKFRHLLGDQFFLARTA